MLRRALLLALIAFFLVLPLRDILAYPDRVSVLPNLQTDAAAYYMLGHGLSESWSIAGLPPRHPPGWIVALALAFAVGGASYVTGKLVLWMALILSVGGCAWLARRLYGNTAAWIAAVICASSGALRWYVSTVQYEVFIGAMLLGVLALGLRATDAGTPALLYRRAAWTGVVGALLVLSRETFSIVLPVVSLWMAQRVVDRTGRRPAIIVALLVTGISLAPAIAWTVVQSVRFRQLITISEKGPIVVELGHNPLANGTYNAPLVGIGRPTGLTFALENPGREVTLSIRKVLYFWGVLRDGWNVPRPAAVWLWRASTGLISVEFWGALARGGWLLALFVIALWQWGRRGLAVWWIVPGVVVLIMLAHIVTLSSHRFAVPTLPIIFAIVSGPLAWLLERVRPSFRSWPLRAAAALLVAVVIAMQFQQWPLAVHLRAADLDGLTADNRVDEVSGTLVRLADAARGLRPVVLLADEYLARGTILVQARVRRVSERVSDAAPGASMSIVDLAGKTICATEVAAGALPHDRYDVIPLRCELARDSVATLAIFSLGSVDLAIDDVTLAWVRPTP